MEFNLEYYQASGKITSNGIKYGLSVIKPGEKISDLCKQVDSYLIQELDKVFKKKTKGISFPTCICVDNIVGHYSPLDSESSIVPDNCLVSLECGTHIDNYPTKACISFAIGNVDNETVKLLADVKNAVLKSVDTFKEGKTNFSTNKKIKKMAELNNYQLPYVNDPDLKTPGLFSYQMSRTVIDGKNDENVDDSEIHKMIVHRDHIDYDFIGEESEYDKNEVYCLDVAFCTNDGKLSPTSDRITLFRRDFEKKYYLKLKSSKSILSSFNNNNFVKHIRDLDKKNLLGIKECMTHKLLIPYGVFKVKTGKIARFEISVCVSQKKPIVLTDIFNLNDLEFKEDINEEQDQD